MSRGLPYSIIIHLLILALVAFLGNSVSRQEIRTPRSIRVRVVELPRAPEAKPAEATPEPAVQSQPEEAVPDLPPKEVPKPKPKPEKKPEKKPEQKAEKKPEVKQPEAKATEPMEQAAEAAPQVAGPSVEGTDVDFPFAWYLASVQGQIARNWNPRQLGFRENSVVSCVVHFTINKNGKVSRVTLTRPSGVSVFDREALRVVQSSRIPPLPPGFASPTLGVSMKFNLESGI